VRGSAGRPTAFQNSVDTNAPIMRPRAEPAQRQDATSRIAQPEPDSDPTGRAQMLVFQDQRTSFGTLDPLDRTCT
jgi:hypothetical protein